MLKFIIPIVVAIALFPFVLKFIKHKSLYPFMPYQYNFRRRRITFAKVLKLLTERNAKIIVETGTSRKGLEGAKSDGAATIVFGKWAKENGAVLHSVDISEDSVEGSRNEVKQQRLDDVVTVHLDDSLNYLKHFKDDIDFLYLDSYDYSKTDVDIQKKSQEHHLKEFKIIEDRLHKNTIVLIDDCGLPGGGKGKTVVAYMIEKGWEILINKYQILLVHKDSL
ncbi:class I SAM-dependent methyltransferase [Ichthyenterobacterium sp. W332]|uniref:Class I SAM-dependent methyltransferase n=1 Tax=Microcosmobacter mediterraneus TaxID=3075607 RepID=A0ABU2YMX2_9FLAO|nr:class I SAM-dependent methyltransferase [Ichthyenterobacterium sp. W332]MDT0559518.1 class I SAM-dependent methyltransferase [Ichthyenterobacterium sp. W332]